MATRRPSPALLALLVAIVVIVLGAGWWFWSRSGGEADIAVDFLERFPAAEKRSTGNLEIMLIPGSYRLRGEVRRGLYMHPTSRVTFRGVVVPPQAVVRTWVGLREEAWEQSTDGVLFRLGVAHDGNYLDVIKKHVNPAHVIDDRRWLPVEADLSAYAGQTVDVVFNTNSSLPGQGDDSRSDFAVWGEPAIIVRH